MFFFGNESAKVNEQRHLAAVEADQLQAQLIPDYPSVTEIKTIDDVHEAANQIDLLKSLSTYSMNEVVWQQATAHDELQGGEWYGIEQAEKYNNRIKKILSLIPDQPS